MVYFVVCVAEGDVSDFRQMSASKNIVLFDHDWLSE